MRFNPKARLDKGQVRDAGGGGRGGRGGGGSRGGMRIPMPRGRVAGGGVGGILLVIVVLAVNHFLGGGTSSGGLDTSQLSSGEGSERYSACETGADANESEDCARVAVVNSIQDYWTETLPQQSGTDYALAQTTTFQTSIGTGCGNATSQVGPFYCPPDQGVYLDTTFFDDVLERQLGGPSGAFVEPYVIAHEYGHHVQNLLGTMGKVRTQQGPDSDAVRLELQADCYAGMWTRSATQTEDESGSELIQELTWQDIADAIDAAKAVGDDRIQQKSSGRVDPESWTHGSAEDRVRWFNVGYESGDLRSCDTFSQQLR